MLDKQNETSNNFLDRIILIPYANKDNANTGVNIKDNSGRIDLYLKNCCVALASARYYNPDCDVALATNIDVPSEYLKFLNENTIKITKIAFENFTFEDQYLWNLAFYKLCVIDYVVKNYNYKYVSYMDSDVYVQSSFENIWKECNYSILLYDINHGLQVRDYRLIVEEFKSFTGEDKLITHYGGEFFASNRENAKIFIEKCKNIYNKMIEQDFETTKGDEFILSLAASQTKELVKNAGPYIFRFWTSGFRLVSTCYINNQVTVLHVPAEKESGMLKIYKKYIVKNKIPSNSKVYRLLRIDRIPLSLRLKLIVKKLLK